MLFQSLFAFPVRRQAAHGQPARFRPAVEPLAERCLPRAGLGALSPAPAVAALVADAGQTHDQPFRLSGAGLFTPVSPADVTFTASGTATSLGRWTNHGELHFDGNHGTGTAVFT